MEEKEQTISSSLRSRQGGTGRTGTGKRQAGWKKKKRNRDGKQANSGGQWHQDSGLTCLEPHLPFTCNLNLPHLTGEPESPPETCLTSLPSIPGMYYKCLLRARARAGVRVNAIMYKRNDVMRFAIMSGSSTYSLSCNKRGGGVVAFLYCMYIRFSHY